jgi:hypothetical protein
MISSLRSLLIGLFMVHQDAPVVAQPLKSRSSIASGYFDHALR